MNKAGSDMLGLTATYVAALTKNELGKAKAVNALAVAAAANVAKA